MEVTKLTSQIKNADRINVFLDNKYAFSLDISQIVDLGVKVGVKYNEDEINNLKQEGEFSKYYSKALAYSFVRPRSIREMSDYLYRQTKTKYFLIDGVKREKQGMTKTLIDPIIDRLKSKGYLDDDVFAKYWVENRNLKKGISNKVLRQELAKKGIKLEIVNTVLNSSGRDDKSELKKVIDKKQHKYIDESKFIKYLISKGYNYALIQEVLSETKEDVSWADGV